ncbi:hypothetical protein QWI17_19595 [Gilvimarinus sp. SDUM040013]|uniref:Uncharacterized protein n=1 Tax=Gilvimarinus gilvus TaxID=3058038 RepID=A0ABU4S389_9GAMM|nr:hypothetical protein [Gilvimarinus sp. SDUM040013]MDO3388059.1 hypothetical protein [Gilvimarinus sp. SDUM040013]MDX6850967.1 hypothetical protein [Gilvimarinus sp. SDUM040013]
MFRNSRKIKFGMVAIFTFPIFMVGYLFVIDRNDNRPAGSLEFNEAPKYADEINKSQARKNAQKEAHILPDGQREISKDSSEGRWAIFDRWQEKESVSVAKEYRQYYSEEQLLAMADSGDLNAINALVGMYTFGDYQRAKKLSMIEKGIVEGSSYILMTAANFYRISAFSNSGKNYSTAKVNLIESLAYMELLNDRDPGVIFPLDSMKKSMIRKFNQEYEESSEFSLIDEAAITERAQELHDYYESLRLEKGLGTFSSEHPNIVENYVTAN